MESISTIGIYFFALALAMSQLEIQIEGKIPWAGALPCWRRQTPFKELTAYHFWMGVLITLIFVYPYATEKLPLGYADVLEWISEIILGIFLFEDFLWNATHPSKEFGFGVYRGKEKQYPAMGGIYFAFIPLDYAIWAAASLLFFGFSGGEMMDWIEMSATMIALAIVVVPFMQSINRRTGASKRYDDFVRKHKFEDVSPEGRINQQKTRDVVAIAYHILRRAIGWGTPTQ